MAAARTTTRGRKRSETARAAIVEAALTLLERDGWARLTMEAIAAEAGVGKTTIYRWWPNRGAVLMDAMVDRSDTAAAFPDTGDALTDLATQMRSIIRLFTRTAQGKALLVLIAESQHDPELVAALRDRLIAARRAGARQLLERGVERGQLRADLQPDLVIDALYGAIYYRLLVSHEKTTPKYADALIAHFAPAMEA